MKKIYTLFIIATLLSIKITYAQQKDILGNPVRTVLPMEDYSVIPNLDRTESFLNFTVIHQIPAPVSGVNDIAFDGQDLWMSSFGTNTIVKFSRATGAVIKTIPTLSNYPNGLEFDGTHLWMTDNTNKTVQMLDTANGTVLASFPTPAMAQFGTSYVCGLTLQDNDIWINDPRSGGPNNQNYISRITTADSILNSFIPTSVSYYSGLGFDGNYLWSSDNANNTINKIDTATYTIVQTYHSPSTGGYPNGITWDGDHLWIADNGVDSVYEVATAPVGIATVKQKPLSVSVYPNPVITDAVIIFSNPDKSKPYYFNLYDALGRLVMKIPITGNSTAIHKNGLACGTYVYSITDKEELVFKGKLMME